MSEWSLLQRTQSTQQRAARISTHSRNINQVNRNNTCHGDFCARTWTRVGAMSSAKAKQLTRSTTKSSPANTRRILHTQQVRNMTVVGSMGLGSICGHTRSRGRVRLTSRRNPMCAQARARHIETTSRSTAAQSGRKQGSTSGKGNRVIFVAAVTFLGRMHTPHANPSRARIRTRASVGARTSDSFC